MALRSTNHRGQGSSITSTGLMEDARSDGTSNVLLLSRNACQILISKYIVNAFGSADAERTRNPPWLQRVWIVDFPRSPMTHRTLIGALGCDLVKKLEMSNIVVPIHVKAGNVDVLH